MDKYELQYNPYLAELSFTRIVGKKKEECFCVNKRLQNALTGGEGNWPGLIKKMIQSTNNRFHLTFIGRKMDYDDLDEVIRAHNSTSTPYIIECEHIPAFESKQIAQKAIRLITDVQKRNIPEINAHKKKLDEAVSKIQDEAMEVNVVGLYSSGKSTLINALLGTPLLPMNVKVTSNKVVELVHEPNKTIFVGTAKNRAGKIIKNKNNVSLNSDIMAEWNNDTEIDTIEITGRIPFVPKGRKLIIRDTPGYGNADVDAQHDKLVNGLAETTADNAVFLCLLTPDTYQGGACDDNDNSATVKGLLKSYANLMNRFGKEFRDKFIFVLTFADELADQDSADMAEEMLELKRKLSEYGIQDPIIVPVNSKLALLIRRKVNGGNILKKEQNDFNKYEDYNSEDFPEYKFEQYASISPSGKKIIDAILHRLNSDTSIDARYQEAIIHCGIPALEQTVLDFWDKYLIPKRIQEGLSQIQSICKEVITKLDFFQQLEDDEAKLEQVKKQLGNAADQQHKIVSLRENISNEIAQIHLNVNADEWKKKAESLINESAKSVKHHGTVPVDKARSILYSFRDNIMQIKQNLENELRCMIESTFLDRASELYEKYQSACAKILELKIGQLSIKSLNGFSSFFMDNGVIGNLIAAYKSPVYKTVKVKNPEREGFWGFFKFWKPREIEKEQYVRDDVDIPSAVADPISKANSQLKQDIDEMIAEAQENLIRLRAYFDEELNKLQVLYFKAIEEFTVKTRETKSIQAEIEKLKQDIQWANEINSQINELWEG